MNFNPLDHPACLEFPVWLEETAWAGHIPFAMFLVSAARPRTLVELGTFRGVSYCAFCQAVSSQQTGTKCYAVDTWQGDEHSGELEAGVLQKLKSHHDPLYGDFSSLIQSTFDDALGQFADGSIDLLHIDGLHTYDAVRHDYETWRPKMSDRGIILFHDIEVREGDFGVWKLWQELGCEFPNFSFTHSHGLGVLAVGSSIPENIRFLFEASEDERHLIREFFDQLGSRIESAERLRNQQAYIKELQAFERTVRYSRLMKLYHVLKEEGVGGVSRRLQNRRSAKSDE